MPLFVLILLAGVFISVGFMASNMKKVSALQRLLEENRKLLEEYAEGRSFSEKQLEAIQRTVDDFLLNRKDDAVNSYIEGIKGGKLEVPEEIALAVQTHQDRYYAEMQRIVQGKLKEDPKETEELITLRRKNVELLEQIDKLKESQVDVERLRQEILISENLRSKLAMAETENNALSERVSRAEAETSQLKDVVKECESLRQEIAELKHAQSGVPDGLKEYITLVKKKSDGEKLSLEESLAISAFEKRVLS